MRAENLSAQLSKAQQQAVGRQLQAHTEQPGEEAARLEWLNVVEVLAGAEKRDGTPRGGNAAFIQDARKTRETSALSSALVHDGTQRRQWTQLQQTKEAYALSAPPPLA